MVERDGFIGGHVEGVPVDDGLGRGLADDGVLGLAGDVAGIVLPDEGAAVRDRAVGGRGQSLRRQGSVRRPRRRPAPRGRRRRRISHGGGRIRWPRSSMPCWRSISLYESCSWDSFWGWMTCRILRGTVLLHSGRPVRSSAWRVAKARFLLGAVLFVFALDGPGHRGHDLMRRAGLRDAQAGGGKPPLVAFVGPGALAELDPARVGEAANCRPAMGT